MLLEDTFPSIIQKKKKLHYTIYYRIEACLGVGKFGPHQGHRPLPQKSPQAYMLHPLLPTSLLIRRFPFCSGERDGWWKGCSNPSASSSSFPPVVPADTFPPLPFPFITAAQQSARELQHLVYIGYTHRLLVLWMNKTPPMCWDGWVHECWLGKAWEYPWSYLLFPFSLHTLMWTLKWWRDQTSPCCPFWKQPLPWMNIRANLQDKH